jgi:hypothetical protein
VLGLFAGSDVLFSGQLIVLQFDKESPRYTYEEPALHMTGNAVADSVSIHPSNYTSRVSTHGTTISLSHALDAYPNIK